HGGPANRHQRGHDREVLLQVHSFRDARKTRGDRGGTVRVFKEPWTLAPTSAPSAASGSEMDTLAALGAPAGGCQQSVTNAATRRARFFATLWADEHPDRLATRRRSSRRLPLRRRAGPLRRRGTGRALIGRG